MYEIDKILKELDKKIEQGRDGIATKRGLAYEDFIAYQVSIRTLQSVKDFIIDDVLNPTEEEKEDGETDGNA